MNIHNKTPTKVLQKPKVIFKAVRKPKGDETRLIVSLDRLVKKQHVWGFHQENVTFRKLEPPDLLESCPSCGAGPIKWSAIRNKRHNNRVSRLRCNRQAKGTCDYRGALRRTERKRMLRSSIAPTKHTWSQPIEQAFGMLSEAMQLLQMADKPTLHSYITSMKLPLEIRQFMMQFLVNNPRDRLLGGGSAVPTIPEPNKFSFGTGYPTPGTTVVLDHNKTKNLRRAIPLLRSAMLATQEHQSSLQFLQQLHQEKQRQERQSSSAWNFGTMNTLARPFVGKPSNDEISPLYGGPRIGRFSSGMGLNGMVSRMDSGMGSRIASGMAPRMVSGMGLASARWCLGPSFDGFGSSSLSTGANNRDLVSSLMDPLPLSPGQSWNQNQEPCAAIALAQLANEASRSTANGRPNRKRELNEKHGMPPKKTCSYEFTLDPPCTLPKTKTNPPIVSREANTGTSAKGLAAVSKSKTGAGVVCPCCMQSSFNNEQFCLACGSCLRSVGYMG